MVLFSAAAVQAAAVDDLLKDYRAAGVAAFDAKAGESFWKANHGKDDKGRERSCQACHGTDLRKPGTHQETGKVIDAMAPSVNAERLIDTAKIEKWFKRNCKTVLERECTLQEKGNVLMYLRQQ
ncbi:MAG: DUF1924 domain-containing protein [Magnetococcales bacterium]|nr:DUF1924 domain-containing protein [Magnetococcales bacterium]